MGCLLSSPGSQEKDVVSHLTLGSELTRMSLETDYSRASRLPMLGIRRGQNLTVKEVVI